MGRVSKRQNQALIARERGLNVTDQQVAQFKADCRDYLIVEAFLHGKVKIDDITEWTEIGKATVRDRLLCPVRAAWISKQLDVLVPTRLGMVMGALFTRAVTSGDPSASRLLLEQYGKLRTNDVVKRNLNLNVNVDYTQFSIEQLKKMAEQEARAAGLTLNDAKSAREVMEAEFEVKGKAAGEGPEAGGVGGGEASTGRS